MSTLRSFRTLAKGGLQGDPEGMGRAGATHHDELPGNPTDSQGGDAEHDDTGTLDPTAVSSHLRGATGTSSRIEDVEQIRGSPARWTEGCVSSC